jgi:hypothetical protein
MSHQAANLQAQAESVIAAVERRVHEIARVALAAFETELPKRIHSVD